MQIYLDLMAIQDLLPSFSVLCQCLSISGSLIMALVVIPAVFGGEIGIRRGYISILLKVFKWGTARIQKESATQSTNLRTHADEIISKENSINRLGSLNDCINEPHKKFELADVVYLIKSGIEAVIDDEVTKRFRAEELPSWNLLTRTNVQYQYIRDKHSGRLYHPSIRLSILWFIGVILRYFILLPLRLAITVFAMIWLVGTILPLTVMADSSFKRKIAYYVNVVAFRIICRGFSAVVTYHDRENMPKPGGICVANHTTTLDAAVLMQDRPYAILGQIHGGYLGWIMRMMSRATKHVWFERSEVRDRQFVSKRIMEHVSDENNYPVLLFPEGTCINNTSVMMFKKGSFEIPTTIYPVAIKYNPWFGDAFWNSSKHSMIQYLLVVMTSWAIVADVWYLPAMKKEPNENAMQFAERVKAVIARKGGLVDCVWDGQLKRMRVKESYLQEKQKELGVLFTEEEDGQCSHKKKVRFDIDSNDSENEESSDSAVDIQESGEEEIQVTEDRSQNQDGVEYQEEQRLISDQQSEDSKELLDDHSGGIDAESVKHDINIDNSTEEAKVNGLRHQHTS